MGLSENFEIAKVVDFENFCENYSFKIKNDVVFCNNRGIIQHLSHQCSYKLNLYEKMLYLLI